jgi:hypothetical protein
VTHEAARALGTPAIGWDTRDTVAPARERATRSRATPGNARRGTPRAEQTRSGAIVTHGIGTAEIFRRRNDVLYARIHQARLHPDAGLTDQGLAGGLGRTLDLAVLAGCDGDVWRSLLEHVILPSAGASPPIWS